MADSNTNQGNNTTTSTALLSNMSSTNRPTFTSASPMSSSSFTNGLLGGPSMRSQPNLTNNTANKGISPFSSNTGSMFNSNFNKQDYADTFGKSFNSMNSSFGSMAQNITSSIEKQTQELMTGFKSIIESLNSVHETIQKIAEDKLNYEHAVQNFDKRREEYAEALKNGITGMITQNVTQLWKEIFKKPDIQGLKETFTSYLFENFRTFGRVFGVNFMGPPSMNTADKPVAFTEKVQNAILYSYDLLKSIEASSKGIYKAIGDSNALSIKEKHLTRTTEYQTAVIDGMETMRNLLLDIKERFNPIIFDITNRKEQLKANLRSQFALDIELNKALINSDSTLKDDEKRKRISALSNLANRNDDKTNNSQKRDLVEKTFGIAGLSSKKIFSLPDKFAELITKNFKGNKNDSIKSEREKKIQLKAITGMDKLVEALKANVSGVKKLEESQDRLASISNSLGENLSGKQTGFIDVINNLFNIMKEPLNIFRGVSSTLMFFAKWGGIYKAADWLIGKGREGINYISGIGLGNDTKGNQRTVGSVTSGIWSGLKTFVDPLIIGIRDIFKDFIGEDTFNRISDILSTTKIWVSNLWTGLFGPDAERKAAREELFGPMKKAITYATEKVIVPALFRGYAAYTGVRTLLHPGMLVDNVLSLGSQKRLQQIQFNRQARQLANTWAWSGMTAKQVDDTVSEGMKTENAGLYGLARKKYGFGRSGLGAVSRFVTAPLGLVGTAFNLIPVIGQIMALGQMFSWLTKGLHKLKSWYDSTSTGEGSGFSGFVKESVNKFFSTAWDTAKELFPIARRALWDGITGLFVGLRNFLYDNGWDILVGIKNGFFELIDDVWSFVKGKGKDKKNDDKPSDVSDNSKDSKPSKLVSSLKIAAGLGLAWKGASMGAAAGSIIPGLGTTAGAIVGGIGGVLGGLLGGYFGSNLVEEGTTELTGSKEIGKVAGMAAGIAGGVGSAKAIAKSGAQLAAKAGGKLGVALKGSSVPIIGKGIDNLGRATIHASHVASKAAKTAKLTSTLGTVGALTVGGVVAKPIYDSYIDEEKRNEELKKNPWLNMEQGALVSSLGRDILSEDFDFTKFQENISKYKSEFESLKSLAKEKGYGRGFIKNLNLASGYLDTLAKDNDQFNKLQAHIKSGQFKIDKSIARNFDVEGKSLLDAVKSIQSIIAKDIKSKQDKENKKKEEEDKQKKEEADRKYEEDKSKLSSGVASLGQLSQWIQNGTAKRWLNEQFTNLGDHIKGAWNFLKNRDYKKMFGSAMEVFGGITGNLMSAIFGEDTAERWLTNAMKYTSNPYAKKLLAGARSSILTNVKDISKFAADTNQTVKDILKKLEKDWNTLGVPQDQRKIPWGADNPNAFTSYQLYNLKKENPLSADQLALYNRGIASTDDVTHKDTYRKQASDIVNKSFNLKLYNDDGTLTDHTAEKDYQYGFAGTYVREGGLKVNSKEVLYEAMAAGDKSRQFWSRTGIYAAKLPMYVNSPAFAGVVPSKLAAKVKAIVGEGKANATIITRHDDPRLQKLNQLMNDPSLNDEWVTMASNVYKRYQDRFKQWPFPTNVMLGDSAFQKGNAIDDVKYAARILGYTGQLTYNNASSYVLDLANKYPYDVGAALLMGRIYAKPEYATHVHKVAAIWGYTRRGEKFTHPKMANTLPGVNDTNDWTNQSTTPYSRISDMLPQSSGLRITSGFGERIHPVTKERKFHTGIDIAGNNIEGNAVKAFFDGKITKIDSVGEGAGGKYVEVEHDIAGNKYYSRYMHLKDIATDLKVGQNLSKSQYLGTVGRTGRVTGAHLHFDMREGRGLNQRNFIDPMQFLSIQQQALPDSNLSQETLHAVSASSPQSTAVNKLSKDFSSRLSDASITSDWNVNFFGGSKYKAKLESQAVRLKEYGLTSDKIEELLSKNKIEDKASLDQLDKLGEILSELVAISAKQPDNTSLAEMMSQVRNNYNNIVINSDPNRKIIQKNGILAKQASRKKR